MVITHEKDMEIRARQTRRVCSYVSLFLQRHIVSYSVEYTANYDPAIGFYLFASDEIIDDICKELNENARKNNSAIKFLTSHSAGEIEWDSKLLFATWAPYYWEDENWGLHKLHDLRRVDEIKYDVCAIYPADNLPKLGKDDHEKAIYTNGEW